MLAKTNSWPSCQRPQEKTPVWFAKYKSARGSLSWIEVQLCASKGFIHFTSKPFYKPDIIMSREKNAKQKTWCAASSLLAKLEGRKRAIVRLHRPARSAVPTDRTASVTLCIAIAPCRSLPAHHNIIMFHFFPSQGRLFSLIQDNSCRARPWCLLKTVRCVCLLFQAWQSPFSHSCLTGFLAAKKTNAFSPETSMGLSKGAPRVLSTHLYCNLPPSQVVLGMCWGDALLSFFL